MRREGKVERRNEAYKRVRKKEREGDGQGVVVHEGGRVRW